MNKAIGGYFGLENSNKNLLFEDLIHLNTARNCLEYILRANSEYSKIWIPYYTCDVLLEPIKKLNLQYDFYDVDDNLEAILDWNNISNEDIILLTNYFGIKSNYIEKIAQKQQNIVIDNAQALFAKPIKNVDTIYSPRKFVGLPDGGLLQTNKTLPLAFQKDVSYTRMLHLLKRLDLSAEDGYTDFRINDASLQNNEIKEMSNLTQQLFKNVDYNTIIKTRITNFNFLHQHLESTNLLPIKLAIDDVPMVYPYRVKNSEAIKKRLLEKRIYCATYWPNVFKWCDDSKNSFYLAKEIIAIPIDQRLSIDEMQKILSYV